MLSSLEHIHSAGRSQSMDKSLPLSEKAEEKEKEEEGVVRSLHWEPRKRWNPRLHSTLFDEKHLPKGASSPRIPVPPLV